MIPFCEFGGNMSVMGVEINDFHIPFCTGFEEKIINDQLCYSINLNKTRQKNPVKEEHDLTFKLFISYNEDRQFDSMIDVKMPRKVDDSNLEKYVLIETIGRLLHRGCPNINKAVACCFSSATALFILGHLICSTYAKCTVNIIIIKEADIFRLRHTVRQYNSLIIVRGCSG